MIYNDLIKLHKDVDLCLNFKNGQINVTDKQFLVEKLIDDLVYSTVFSENKIVEQKCKYIILNTAKSLGIIPCSTNNLYKNGFAKEKIKEITVPAINIRTMTYDIAQLIFKEIIDKKIGILIFEIARSEINYTKQSPSEYASCILAAAIKTGYKGPIFLQGDHYQFNKKSFEENKLNEIQNLKNLIKESINSFFYNIDIDASTLVDYDKKNIKDQQKENYKQTAELTKYIRTIQPKNITVSIGGEIGHIGEKNSTVEEFNTFMNDYNKEFENGKTEGISKISIQTGSTHGGAIGQDGKIIDVDIDFEIISSIGSVAKKKYNLGGVVQHAASTLPDELFNYFPKHKTLEIHLASEFQNIIFECLSEDLKRKINDWILKNCKNEWKKEWSQEQFIYKLRKKAFGYFKKELWSLKKEEKEKILIVLNNKFNFLFKQLNIVDTKSKVEKYI
jgi:fructose/tagatose bisphosphate aldolase